MSTGEGGGVIVVASGSDAGRMRRSNQDRVWPEPGRREFPAGSRVLLVVADGMGGAAGGATASGETVGALIAAWRDTGGEPRDLLLAGITGAGERLHGLAQDDPSLRDMGTTVVAAAVTGGRAVVANVGDSRCYLVRGTALRQVTDDHSLVAELVREGVLTKEQAARHPQRNIITRSVGPGRPPAVDLFEEALVPGDRLVLCSDGLFGVVGDEEIAAIAGTEEPARAVARLIALANERGGPDNISVVIARIPPDSQGQ